MFPIGDYFFCDDSLMPDNPTVIEVGVFTIDCASAIFQRWPKARYICIEPSSSNFYKLVTALSAFRVNIKETDRELPPESGIEPYRVALAAKDEVIPFYEFMHEQWHSTFPRHKTEGMVLKSEDKIQGYTLKTILDTAQVQTCDLILCNAEGAEIFAMQQLAADADLRKRVTQFCTSMHCSHVKIYSQWWWDEVVAKLTQWYTISQRVTVPEIPYFLFQRKP